MHARYSEFKDYSACEFDTKNVEALPLALVLESGITCGARNVWYTKISTRIFLMTPFVPSLAGQTFWGNVWSLRPGFCERRQHSGAPS